MTAVERILKIAAGEVGVTEYPPGSNKVKYNTWFYGREVSGASYPWCCAFVCWVFHQAGLDSLIRKTGGCTTMMNWFKAKGQLVPVREAKPGDLVFYQFDKDAYADHIGIVESVNKNGVVAIEGNTSVTSNDNGGAVMRRSRKWSVIMAVARPDYESVDRANRKEEIEMPNEEEKKLIATEVAAQIKPLDEALTKAIQGLPEDKTYHTVNELPEWVQPAVIRLKDAGIITGDGQHEINLTDRDLVAVSLVDKLAQKIENW